MSSADRGRTLVEGLRSHVLVDCARAARRYRWVFAITAEVHAQAAGWVGFASRQCVTRGGAITEHDLDVQAGLEVSAATGLAAYHAEQEVQVARTLVTVLPATLGMLECGRIDQGRARVLAEEVVGLPVATARKVERVVLDGLPAAPLDGDGPVGPWDGCSPRAFTARVRKAVAQVRKDTEEKVRDDVRAQTGTWVRVHPENPALTTMTVTGPTELVLGLEATLDAAARAMAGDQRAGRTLGMTKVDLLAHAVTGIGTSATSSPGSATDTGATDTGGAGPDGSDQSDSDIHGAGGVGRCRVRRELGIVLNADTLFGDGPAAGDPGEVRGAGEPVSVSAATARVLAEQATANNATTCVLLADRDGMLTRLLRVGTAPAGGWTRTSLTAAAKRVLALAPQPQHQTETYQPTAQIADTVRARDPVCTLPGCGVPASRADLDHTVPHPRGPTSVQNLSPLSRRCHRYKTAGLWHVRALTDEGGQVVAHEWTTLLGTRQVVEGRQLPGYGAGEGYAGRVR